MVLGAAVWLAIAVCWVVWLAVVLVGRGTFIGPLRVLRWAMRSWLPRAALLTAWAAAGWHVFCQRP